MEPQSMGEQSGAADQVAQSYDSQGQSTPAEQMVPLSALQSMRHEKQQLQQSLKLVQDHVLLLQANGGQQTMNQPEPREDDVVTYGELKKLAAQRDKVTKAEVLELKMQQAYPDYGEVVRTFLPQALSEDPDLRSEIENAQNPYKLAYKLAKKSDAYQKVQREKMTSPEAVKAIANSQKTGNLSAVGSVSQASTQSAWRTMSDAEFLKHAERNLG
jgi:hypothetical protein